MSTKQTWNQTKNIFIENPWACLILAVICLLGAVLNLTDLIPSSPNRPFRQEFGWIISVLGVALSCLFAYYATVGFRKKN